MDNFHWKLQEYKGANTRFRCPKCHKPREYTRYIDSEGNYAPFEYGKCNREIKCGYFNYPNSIETHAPIFTPEMVKQEFINWNNYKYNLNTDSDLVKSMITFFGDESKVIETLKKYYVRTENNYMIFPYINKSNQLTYVKKMGYNGFNRTKYIYTPYKAKTGVFKQCLFGLHLVDNSKIIHVVESEKTALICDIFYPEYTWVATGGLNMISKINDLESGVIFPDKGKSFEKWSDRVDTTRFTMNDLLENSDSPEGSDLADYILRI